MSRFVFNGRIRPEWRSVRIDVQNPPLRITAQDTRGGDAEIVLLLGASDISVVVSTTSDVADLSTFRNEVITAVRVIFDALTYHSGKSIQIELSTILDLEKNQMAVYEEQVDELIADQSQRPQALGPLVNLAVSDVYLRRALRDLHQAMIVPEDTLFYCFRAVESLIHTFRRPGDEGDKPARNRLTAALNVDPELISNLGSASNPSRHGQVQVVNGRRRVTRMEQAWKIVDRYIEYCLTGDKALPIDRFPRLMR